MTSAILDPLSVLSHPDAQPWDAEPYAPAEGPLGRPHHCFETAHAVALERGLRYVEGVATIPHGDDTRFVWHAWAGTDDGRAVEVTWSKYALGYVGIARDPEPLTLADLPLFAPGA